MKQLLTILFSLLSLVAFAQEATVKSVAVDPFNISASKYPMTDLNGNTAPLVIVRVLADDVQFQGSVLSGGVKPMTGEYWVYMGSGAKFLHIHSSKFLPVEIYFPDYDIPRLESAATYIVTLALPQAVAQAAASTFSTTPLHLALCAYGPDGRAVYITEEQWKSISESEQSSYVKKGVCLSENGEKFLVKLAYSVDYSVEWRIAKEYNLPTKEQGEVMIENKVALNKAMELFGGSQVKLNYWTKTEIDSIWAWTIDMISGKVTQDLKGCTAWVIAVTQCP